MSALTFLLFGLTAWASAINSEQCYVGEWTEWGECLSSKQCSNNLPIHNYQMSANRGWDTGRDAMNWLMKEKASYWKKMADCKAAGTCPEQLMRPMSGSYICDTWGVAGDIPCNNIDQLAFLDFAQLGYQYPVASDKNVRGNDIWGWTDPLNGDEYAIIGLTGGTSFVRVTNPQNPVPVGFLYTATVASNWRDIKVIGNYAYIVSEAKDHGLQVFDLTHLRGRSSLAYFPPDAVNNDFGQAHNIVENVDTNFVYVVGATDTSYPLICDGGLLVIDVSDPLNPTYAGCYGGDGYVHDAQCVIYHGPDANYYGAEVCFSFNEDSLTIVDVTDKANMYMITKTGYENVAYTHQGWLTENHELILLDDELDEIRLDEKQTRTYLWNVKDLSNPQLMNIYESSETSIDHNQYIVGEYVYQSNYEAGLRLLRMRRPTLTQVGYFDVYPSGTEANFAGTWSVYPFFQSGNIVVSSIDYGLFIVKPQWYNIEQQVASKTTYAEQTRSRTLLSVYPGAVCPHLQESRICSAPKLC